MERLKIKTFRNSLAFLVLIKVIALVESRAIDESRPDLKSGHCKHRFPTVDELPHPILLDQQVVGKIVKREAEHQLRIEVIYDKSVDKLEEDKKFVVKTKVVPDAVHFWEQALKIRRSEGPIKINQKCQNNQYFLSDNDPHQYCKETCVPTNCGEVVIPAEHLEACRTCDANGLKCDMVKEGGPGIKDVDFVLYISAIATPQCGETIGNEADTVAYAAHCQQEATLDRPIAGHTNICPQAIVNGTKEIDALYSTIKHELLHALGFSSSLFAFFRDSDGNPRTPRGEDGKPPINHQLQVRQWSENTIKEVTRPYKVRSGKLDRKFQLMVTPKVVEEVRAHFDCPDLEGAELEDQGGDGTSLTHWEKRIFQNEAMTGTVHTQNPTYSRLTLALLEDSGWYLPNYDMAEEITWGRGMGCDMATLSCMEMMERDSKPRDENLKMTRSPFCDTLMDGNTKTSCTHDRSSVGNCNLVQYDEELPEIYQNFDKVEGVTRKNIGKVGGSVSLADFCPYVQEFNWKSDTDSSSRGSQCFDETNNPESGSNFGLEDYGDGSLCFGQGQAWSQRSCTMLKQFRRYGSGCYRYKCDEDDGMLKIVLKSNVTLTCFEEGQTLSVSLKSDEWLHEGSIICPRCEDICGPESCSNSGNLDEVKAANDKLKDDIKEECALRDDNSIINEFLQSFQFKL